MFERFTQKFIAESRVPGNTPSLPADFPAPPGFAEFMAEFSGATFNQGIYRVHTAESVERFTPLVFSCFPTYRARAALFGYDWIGRQFALDKSRIEDGEPQILMFEVDTGEAWEVPDGFIQFHDVEIVDYPDAGLASELWDTWTAAHAEALPIRWNRCVGFKVPLFLGGDNTAADMEETDLEVHWTLTGQLFLETHGMPPGTQLGGIETE
jgi:T6SS immunity protein Tdi1, C-terminal